MARLYDSFSVEDTERFCNEVSEAILNQSIAIFAGAGTSIQYGGNDWRKLIESEHPCAANWSEIEYAQYLILNGVPLKENISEKLLRLKKEIDPNKKNTYLHYLLDFDIDSVWTTNYDSVIEDILTYKGKSKKEIYSYKDFRIISSPSQSFLYKINGSYKDSASLIVTKEDFISYRHTHEGFLILLKRDLLCKNFLFIGTSFRDDILRSCIKDIQYCISNNSDNFIAKHYAIVTSSNVKDLLYITNDIVNNYSINCISIKNVEKCYLLAEAISNKVKFKSIFISGAKRFVRGSKDEKKAKKLCFSLVKIFTNYAENKISNESFKIISGMGMSIGNFISGATKYFHKNQNINRYLKMEPFPFESANSNKKHREQIVKYAGIYFFIYGDILKNVPILESGMWKEYELAKKEECNILIALPIKNSISMEIYKEELKDTNSFIRQNENFFRDFSINIDFDSFFTELLKRICLYRKNYFRTYFKNIIDNIN